MNSMPSSTLIHLVTNLIRSASLVFALLYMRVSLEKPFDQRSICARSMSI